MIAQQLKNLLLKFLYWLLEQAWLANIVFCTEHPVVFENWKKKKSICFGQTQQLLCLTKTNNFIMVFQY
jgi:hypothetical protein